VLIDNRSGIVQHYTDYYLRNLVAGIDLARIHNGSRERLERQLGLLLRDRLAGLGIAVHGVQLVIWPPAGLQETLASAEQHRVGITLQAEQLETILNALTGQSDEARNLALLELARSLGGRGQLWTRLDLASLLDGGPAEPAQPPPFREPQILGWARAIEERPHA
jgi:nitrous oxidase accessory protein NosD